MITNLIKSLEDRFPLLVERGEWSDPILSIGGGLWRFNSTSTWRIVDDQRLVAGCEDSNAKDAIKNLIGTQIVACEALSNAPTLDPRFVFSNGLKLEVFSATVLEPWVFSLSDGPVFVASPSK